MKKLILLLVTAIALAVPAQAKVHTHHHKGPHRTEHVHVSPNLGSASIRGSQRHSVAPKPVKRTTSKHTHHPRPITLPGRPRLDHPHPTMYVIDQHPVIYTTQPHHYRRHNRWYSGFWFWSQNY